MTNSARNRIVLNFFTGVAKTASAETAVVKGKVPDEKWGIESTKAAIVAL